MQNKSLLALSVVAAAALTAERFVGHDGDVADAAGGTLGVVQCDADTGDQVTVDVLGTAVVEASAAIAAGAAIEVATGGKAVTKTSGITVARALEAASASGDRIEVLLIPN